MNKKELTQIIRKNARQQIKIYNSEAKKWSDEEMEFKCQGARQGVKDFILKLQESKIIN